MVPLSSVPSLFWKDTKITKYFVNNKGSLPPNLWALWGADVDFVVRFEYPQCVVLEHVCNNKKVASNLGVVSVFEVELLGLVFAMEYTAWFQWHRLWLERDSTSTLLAFKNSSLIPFRLRNRWHNCVHYRDCNCYADLLASIGHGLVGSIWFDTLPLSLSLGFFRERHNLPNFRFP